MPSPLGEGQVNYLKREFNSCVVSNSCFFIRLCCHAAALNDAVDCQPKHEHCCDPCAVRHQCRAGLLLSDPSEGSDQHEGVAAVSTCDRHD